jgi:hypothetical protein
MAFHPEQRDAGFQLINRFTQEQPFSVLLAQMQSGKTGAYLFTALEMVRQDIVDRVVIICGSSDTSLRSQTKRDLDVTYKAFQMETLRNQDVDGATNLVSATIGVFFSQDLAKIDEIDETTLIIHDESHMAQSKNNIPFKKFYLKNNLEKALMGDFTALRAKSNYILGVSATPFSEIVANKKVTTSDWTTEESALLSGVDLDPKNFFFMQPGEGYIGVPELLLNNSIKFEAENIKTDDCDHIASLLRKGSVKYHKKYVVVRSHRAEKDKDMMETIATSCGYNYVSIFGGSGGENTSLDFMKTEPFDTTLVHICGRFRMGQVVPKQFIAMVYEQSANPNADTILQGLCGRMCGYQAAGSHVSVDIYVSLKAEELVRKYGRAWSEGNMDTLSEVTKAMNLGGVKRKNGGQIVEDKDGVKHIKTVPIKFPISLIERDHGDQRPKFKGITSNDLSNLFEDHPELIENNPDKDGILRIIGLGRGTHNNGAFILDSDSSKVKSSKYFDELGLAVAGKNRVNVSSYSQRVGSRTTEEFEKAPVSLFGSNIGTPGNEEGICYLMAFVRYNPDIHGPVNDELATVDPKCIYVPGIVSMEDDSVLDNVNGGQIITFSLDTADDPDSLETELRQAILRTKEDHPSYIASCTKSIHSLFDKETRLYEGIRLCKSVYTEESIETLKSSLNRDMSVNLKFKKSRGRQPKDQIKYSSISW